MRRTLAMLLCALSFSPSYAERVFITSEISTSFLPTCVCEAKTGFVWVGSMDGLYRYDGAKFTVYRAEASQFSTGITNQISDILELPCGSLALLTNNGQAFVFNPSNHEFTLLPDPSVNNGADYLFVSRIELAEDGRLCLIAPSGRVKMVDDEFNEETDSISKIRFRERGGERKGKWSVSGGTLRRKAALPNGFYVVGDNGKEAVSCDVDRQGRIWYADAKGKVCSADGGAMPQVRDSICVVRSGKSGRIYLGAKGAVYMLSEKGGTFTTQRYGIKDATATDILEDAKGRVWVGTDSRGLLLLKADGGFMDMEGEWKMAYPPSLLRVNCLCEDSDGVIWVGAPDGVTLFDGKEDDAALIRFFFYSSETTELTYSHITDIAEDANGNVWLSTFGGGVYKCGAERFLGAPLEPEPLTIKDLDKDFPVALSVRPSSDGGRLFVLSPLALLDISLKDSVCEEYYFPPSSGFAGSVNSLCGADGGRLLMPSSKGLLCVKENELAKETAEGRIAFTHLKANGKNVELFEDKQNSILANDVDYYDQLSFPPSKRTFSIGLAALSFPDDECISIEYRLKGYFDEWTNADDMTATFTNVPPGEYVLEVRAEDVVRSLQIIVEPRFDETLMAKGLLALLVIVFISLIVYAYVRYATANERNRTEKEMAEARFNFLTDISHEVRTPLTLITAPLACLEQSERMDEEEKRLLGVVKANAERMRRMVNQMLEFASVAEHHVELNITRQTVSEVMEKVERMVWAKAKEKGLTLITEDGTNGAKFDFDEERIETLLLNLVGNAVKFAPSGGHIYVKAEENEQNLRLTVCNDGDAERLISLGENLFSRSYTTGDKSESSGVGLSIVREIVDRHLGKISIEKKGDNGVAFVVSLPAHSAMTICDKEEMPDKESRKKENTEVIENKNDRKSEKKAEVLVQINEDNAEMRQFLRKMLEARDGGRHFKIVEAKDGEEGLSITKENMPDIVVSDVMMPRMSGVEYYKALRSDSAISHIPVILLTAKSDARSVVESLTDGVADYITKPFDIDVLSARIDNILAQRAEISRRIRAELLGKDLTDEEIQSTNINMLRPVSQPTENAPMRQEEAKAEAEKLIAEISKHISIPDIDIDTLASKLRMPRQSLNSKSKALFALTPVELLRELRLKRAAELLTSTDMNIQEISLEVGIADQRYFSRVFKQKFGITPSEYKERTV